MSREKWNARKDSLPMPETAAESTPIRRYNTQNLKPFSAESAREAGAKGNLMRHIQSQLKEYASKALSEEEGEISCLRLARYTNASIMADLSLSPSIRLEASAPFLKRTNGTGTAIQINIGQAMDKRASQVSLAPPQVSVNEADVISTEIAAEMPVKSTTNPIPQSTLK